MIKSIPFEYSHLGKIAPTKAYEGDDNLFETYSTRADFMETVVDGAGTVLAILSGALVFPTNMELSAIISSEIGECPVKFVRHVRERLQWYESDKKLLRVQCYVRADLPYLMKWIEMFGFEPEAVMSKFGPEGSDYILYARVH